MEISNPQYQMMGGHQLQLEEMLLAPNKISSSSTVLTNNSHYETKKGSATPVKPQPSGPALTCPRCESTNTKFCYYNNYSLTQPRYFCKSCRRYWTQGGSLRNVPVGGGCRKNTKRLSSSSSSSKINNPNIITNKPQQDQTLIPTTNPNSAINPLLLTLHDRSFLLPPNPSPNPNPNPNFLDILRGTANSNYGGDQGQQWQFGNNGRNMNVGVDSSGNIVRDHNYNYNYLNEMNGAASYWNGVINSSLM